MLPDHIPFNFPSMLAPVPELINPSIEFPSTFVPSIIIPAEIYQLLINFPTILSLSNTARLFPRDVRPEIDLPSALSPSNLQSTSTGFIPHNFLYMTSPLDLVPLFPNVLSPIDYHRLTTPSNLAPLFSKSGPIDYLIIESHSF